MRGRKTFLIAGIVSFTISTIFFLALIHVCFAANPKLVWDAPTGTNPDGSPIVISGYIVHWGLKATDQGYPNTKKVSATECPLADLNLSPGQSYKFVVSAYNDAGESGYSNEVNWDQPVYNPPEDKIPPMIIIIPGPVTITIGQ